MMKKILFTGIFMLGAAVQAADVTVGNGAGEARSLAEAVARVRTLRSAGKLKSATAVIEVRPGRYAASEPVVLAPEDSNLRIVGSDPSKCVFDGGVALPPFKVGANGIWETDVPASLDFDQLWVGGRRATMARTPNKFYHYMNDLCFDALFSAFILDPQDVAPLAGLSKAERDRVIVSYWQSWDMGFSRVSGLDAKTGRIELAIRPPRQFFFWHRTLPRYALSNYRAALDAPGEWFLDKAASKLLYIPREGETPAGSPAIVPVARGILTFGGDRAANRVVSDVTIEGVGFEHTALSFGPKGIANAQAACNVTDAAIGGSGLERFTMRNCRVAHTGANGLRILFGARHVTIEHSLFEDLGAGAIGFCGVRDAKDEARLNEFITVRDSIVRHGGRIVQGAIGVWIAHARDCLVEHNDIYDFYYTGISLGWTWGYDETLNRRNRIARNRVHHIGQGVLSDMGAVYTLGDNGRSEVCNNWVSDVDGYRDNGSPTFGLYTDEGSRGFLFASNLVENCRYCALHQHYGRENAFVNNLCVGFENSAVLRSRSEDHVTMALTNNVFMWRNPSVLAYDGWGSFEAMAKDVPADGNVYWCADGAITNTAFRQKDFAAWQAAGNDRHGTIADPMFADPERGDWRLKPDSPALARGFVEFDWRDTGVLPADRAWKARAAERTWDEFEELPHAPKFFIDRFDFRARDCLIGNRLDFERAMFIRVYGEDGMTLAPDGKSLRLSKAKPQKLVFAPHIYFKPPFESERQTVKFTFRPVSGDNVWFQLRDYESLGQDGKFLVGFTMLYKDGALSVNGRRLVELPAGRSVEIELKADVSEGAKRALLFNAKRDDGVTGSLEFARMSQPGIRHITWFGFMSYGEKDLVWDLGPFSVRADREQTPPTLVGDALKISFGNADEGFGIRTIENRLAGGATFGNPTDASDPRWFINEAGCAAPATVLNLLGRSAADFWEIQLRHRKALGSLEKAVFLDNRSPCRSKRWQKTSSGATFAWEGVSFPGGEADVTATVSFAPDGTSRWSINSSVRSDAYEKFDTRYPIFRRAVKGGEADWLMPAADLGARLFRNAPLDKRPARNGYALCSSGCLAYAPMMTAFFKGEAGLYYAVHDPRGIQKTLVVSPERDLAFCSPAPDLGFEVTIAALKGDWWEAARTYRRWALTAPWCAKGRILDRSDYPRRICEIPLWLNMHGDAIATSNALQCAKDIFPDVSTGIHWHRWQAVPWEIGHYPEYFPTVPQARETIAYLRSIGQEPMVYTLPRLYSETLLSWHYAKSDAICGPGGNYYVEKYGKFDPPPLVPMCMAQKTYQDVCVDCARRVLDLGGRSIFLDQFSSCPAHACYAPNHSHRPGGGDWFYRGQHEISRRIHDDYAKLGAFTTSEGSCDHFIDVIDGLLTVTQRHPEDVPFWHAVYNGYTTYFCTPENDADDEDSFWAQQARDVMWGHAMGWFHPNILARPDKVALLRKLIDFRQANLDLLAYGELLGEVKIVGPVPRQPVKWLGRVSFPDWGNPKAKLSPTSSGELPGVLAYEWKSGITGKRALLFANLTPAEQTVDYELDGAKKRIVLAPRSFARRCRKERELVL